MSKLQWIDTFLREDACTYLDESDKCCYVVDYIPPGARKPGVDYRISEVINNFKKPINRKNNPKEWHWKIKAIDEIANWLLGAIDWQKAKHWVWVPMPPAEVKDDQNYDNRLVELLNKIREQVKELAIRELLYSRCTREKAHGGSRFTVEQHLNHLDLDSSQNYAIESYKGIVVFDDLITTGAGFKAAKILLRRSFPTLPINGVFIGRRIR
jgi:hypothetical protein